MKAAGRRRNAWGAYVKVIFEVDFRSCAFGTSPRAAALRPRSSARRSLRDRRQVPVFMDVPFPSDAYLVNGRIGADPRDGPSSPRTRACCSTRSPCTTGSAPTFAAFYVDDPSRAAERRRTSRPRKSTRARCRDEVACAADGARSISSTSTRSSAFRVAPRTTSRRGHATGARCRAARGIVPPAGTSHRRGAHVVDQSRRESRHREPELPRADRSNHAQRHAQLYGAALDKVSGALFAPSVQRIRRTRPARSWASPSSRRTRWKRSSHAPRFSSRTRPAPTLAWDATSMAPMGAAKFTSTSPLPSREPRRLARRADRAEAPRRHRLPDRLLPVRAHDAIDAIGSAVFQATLERAPDRLRRLRHANSSPAGRQRRPFRRAGAIEAGIGWHALHPEDGDARERLPRRHRAHGLSSSRDYAFMLANTFLQEGLDGRGDRQRHLRCARARGEVPDRLGEQAGRRRARSIRAPTASRMPVAGGFNGSGDLFGNLLNIGGAAISSASCSTPRSSRRCSARRLGAEDGRDRAGSAHVRRPSAARSAASRGRSPRRFEATLDAWTAHDFAGGGVDEVAVRSPVISSSLNGGALTSASRAISSPTVSPSRPSWSRETRIAFASHLVTSPRPTRRSRATLQFEVIYDEHRPQPTKRKALARAAGMGLATPNVGFKTAGNRRCCASRAERARRALLANVPADANEIS